MMSDFKLMDFEGLFFEANIPTIHVIEFIKNLKENILLKIKEKAKFYDFNGEGYKQFKEKTQEQLAKENKEAFFNTWIKPEINKLTGDLE